MIKLRNKTMSEQKANQSAQTVTQDANSVYQSLFNKINLNPVAK